MIYKIFVYLTINCSLFNYKPIKTIDEFTTHVQYNQLKSISNTFIVTSESFGNLLTYDTAKLLRIDLNKLNRLNLNQINQI